MFKRFLLGTTVALVVLGIAALWYVRKAPSSPEVGRPAPAFQLPSLDGKTMSLNDVRGHPVLINIWATWCVPCEEEMPALQAASATHPELVVLGVDNGESSVRVKPYVQQIGVTFPILLDMDAELVQQYHVVGTPSSFFVDKDGVMRAIYLGAMSADTLATNLAKIGVT